MAEPTKTVFESRFEAIASEDPRFAMAATFAFGDDTPVTRTAGPQSKGSQRPVGADAAWHIGSITKSFTSTLILKLAEQGKLSLHAPVGTLLDRHSDQMHPDWQAITLHQMLSHTAGLPANATSLQMMQGDSDDPAKTRIDLLQAHWVKNLPGEPGTFEYSNIGYVLAGVVAEEVTGQPWETLIRDEIAGPLSLSSLGFGAPVGPDDPWGHKSFLGFKSAVDPDRGRTDNPNWMGPAGRLHISIADLARWGQAHLAACRGERPELLSQQSCLAMRTPVSEDYGYGWVIQSMAEQDATIIWHNGSNTMWYAVLAMIPEQDLVVAVALNRMDAPRVDAAVKDLIGTLLDAR